MQLNAWSLQTDPIAALDLVQALWAAAEVGAKPSLKRCHEAQEEGADQAQLPAEAPGSRVEMMPFPRGSRGPCFLQGLEECLWDCGQLRHLPPQHQVGGPRVQQVAVEALEEERAAPLPPCLLRHLPIHLLGSHHPAAHREVGALPVGARGSPVQYQSLHPEHPPLHAPMDQLVGLPCSPSCPFGLLPYPSQNHVLLVPRL
mmetsp:Transcript_46214/g.107451  ORF Transcript_46214/g.107451 Transcript_46214/m.107451 type:complete len:201 (+) Transcript_46214:456-1058(+)